MKLIESCRPEVQEAMDKFLDTFGGGDGGISFIKLCTFIRSMDAEAQAGNVAAEGIVTIMLRFHKLVKFAESANA